MFVLLLFFAAAAPAAWRDSLMGKCFLAEKKEKEKED